MWFLVKQKYPDYTQELSLSGTPYGEQITQEVQAYTAELQAIPPEELSNRYEKAKEETEAARKELSKREALHREKQYFFNHPNAHADLDHWSKAAYWTVDEANALALGRDPEIVTSEVMERHKNSSILGIHYHKLRILLQREYPSRYNISPAEFLEWVKRNEIDIPVELEESVVKRTEAKKDWKKEYEALKESMEKGAAMQAEASYVSPYMKLMQQAITANSITPTSQGKKDSLTQWFKDQGTSELPVSDKKADMMATLIRSPESGTGGNKKAS